jgi:hypothetical protein
MKGEREELAIELLNAMSSHLKTVAGRFAFVQLRVSAEHLIRDECAAAAHSALRKRPYHVHMERISHAKKVDLLIVPYDNAKENFQEAILYEFKMVWPGGLKETTDKVRDDLDRLAHCDHAYAVAAYFAIEDGSGLAPYRKRALGFEDGLQRFIETLDRGKPVFPGQSFAFAHDEVRGQAQLLAWRAGTKSRADARTA